uniref:Uncharacterized protein n=1 Tax=Rhizophora mucronata TaxID=61149 RepID=A0A2P2KDC7_RHIMU
MQLAFILLTSSFILECMEAMLSTIYFCVCRDWLNVEHFK